MTPSERPLFSEADSESATLVREPQQARSRRTLRRILEASREILDAEGPEALTVTRIAKKAKSSVGSFYARFDGKEDLLRYIGEHALEDATEAWTDIRIDPEHPAPPEACDTLVRGLASILLEGPGRPLVLLDGIEESERPRMRRFEDDVAAGLRELAQSDVSARVAAMAVTSVLAQAARDVEPAGRTRLLEELVRLVSGYLGAGTLAAASAVPDEPGAEAGRDAPGEEPPSPWDAASSSLVEERVTRRAPRREAAAAPLPEPSGSSDDIDDIDDITDLEVAFRDLGEELDEASQEDEVAAEAMPHREGDGDGASGSESPATSVDDSPGESPDDSSEESAAEADPFDVWG